MRNCYAELESQTLSDREEEAGSEIKPQRARMRQICDPFVRVKLSWITDPGLFTARGRLFLWLLHQSRWGQHEVRVTAARAAEIGISARNQSRHVRQLEGDGRVRVNR